LKSGPTFRCGFELSPVGRDISKIDKAAAMIALEGVERAGIDLSLVDVSLGYSYDKRARSPIAGSSTP
jgi:hypothetical protein